LPTRSRTPSGTIKGSYGRLLETLIAVTTRRKSRKPQMEGCLSILYNLKNKRTKRHIDLSSEVLLEVIKRQLKLLQALMMRKLLVK